jgi:hypothetical protein
MADITYEIAALFEQAFGVKSPVFLPTPINIGSNSLPLFPSVELLEVSEKHERLSWMGTPIVYPFKLNGGSYKYYKSNGVLTDKSMSDFEMPAATLVDFSRGKNITKTNVLGGNGSVKEIYGFADWHMRIRGICLTDNTRDSATTAMEQQKKIYQWSELADSLEVSGQLFTNKKIYRFVWQNIAFKQLEGKPNVLPFEITAYSDEPIELILK